MIRQFQIINVRPVLCKIEIWLSWGPNALAVKSCKLCPIDINNSVVVVIHQHPCEQTIVFKVDDILKSINFNFIDRQQALSDFLLFSWSWIGGTFIVLSAIFFQSKKLLKFCLTDCILSLLKLYSLLFFFNTKNINYFLIEDMLEHKTESTRETLWLDMRKVAPDQCWIQVLRKKKNYENISFPSC